MFSHHRKSGNNRDSKLRCSCFTASAGICLSQRKVRQIDDPNQRLLELLHKIIFITQVIWSLFSGISRMFQSLLFILSVFSSHQLHKTVSSSGQSSALRSRCSRTEVIRTVWRWSSIRYFIFFNATNTHFLFMSQSKMIVYFFKQKCTIIVELLK